MRVIFSLAAVLMLAALSQPAWAVCVFRAEVKTCNQDPNTPKYANSMVGARVDPPVENPNPNGKTIVLQPAGSSTDAWVLAPQSTAGAVVLGANPAAAACGSGTAC